MTYGSPYKMTATESVAANLAARERRYEHPEMYNRNIGYARPWTDEERQQIETNVLTALATDPVAAMEILETLGLV